VAAVDGCGDGRSRRHPQVSALEVQQQWFASRCYTSAVWSIPHWFARYDMGTASWLAVVWHKKGLHFNEKVFAPRADQICTDLLE